MYYTYMLRCKDDSIYTGIASDLERRMHEHFAKEGKEAKYTRTKGAKKLEIAWTSQDKSTASKLEYWIKHIEKYKKEELIKNPSLLGEFLGEKINIEEYSVLEQK